MKKTIIRVVALALLAIMTCTLFVACAPASDPDKALEALKENGVEFAAKDDKVIPGVLKLAGVDGVECVVSGTGKIDDEYAHITIIYFEESADAKDAWDDIKDRAEDAKKDAEDSEWVCKKSGKMIYYGTKNAINAAR